jgi:hypothetical protein
VRVGRLIFKLRHRPTDRAHVRHAKLKSNLKFPSRPTAHCRSTWTRRTARAVDRSRRRGVGARNDRARDDDARDGDADGDADGARDGARGTMARRARRARTTRAGVASTARRARTTRTRARGREG